MIYKKQSQEMNHNLRSLFITIIIFIAESFQFPTLSSWFIGLGLITGFISSIVYLIRIPNIDHPPVLLVILVYSTQFFIPALLPVDWKTKGEIILLIWISWFFIEPLRKKFNP